MHRLADRATIKRAYHDLALEIHPDKVHGIKEKERATEKFKEVSHGTNEAFLLSYAPVQL